MPDSIKVNANQWQALSTSDRDKVTQVLKASGLLHDATITPDAAAPVAPPVAAGFLPDSVCKALCSVAEAAAVAACASVPPPGNVLCIAAAHAAADVCRNHC